MAHINGVWVPDDTLREQKDVRAKHMAELNGIAQLTAICAEWTPLLKEIDQDLEMVWFPEGVKVAGVTPGRFHVVKWNAEAPPGLHAVTGPEGEFIFPNSSVLDKIREADLWNDRVIRDREKREKRIEDAKQRQRDRERDERIQEFADRWKALEPSVSMTGQGTGKWTYRAGAKKVA